MESILNNQSLSTKSVQPLCPVFGQCGGCYYQDMAYPDELKIKEKQLKKLLMKSVGISDDIFLPIVPSPKPYYYRNRLDLKLKRTKNNDIFIGFTPIDSRGVISIEECCIADQSISDFIPELKQQAIEQLPKKYKMANLTVRTGDARKVFWGGIGRRSCQLPEQDYFWTEIRGKRIFYSLDTFFQANLSILPRLFEEIYRFSFWDSLPTLYDLYGGVGLFSVGLHEKAERVVLIEEDIQSLKVARYNKDYNQLDHIDIVEGKVEDKLSTFIHAGAKQDSVAMIDPPRAGLSKQACQLIATTRAFKYILYLSCHPKSLAHDLCAFTEQGWMVQRVVPLDFFPKTRHLETLVLLKS